MKTAATFLPMGLTGSVPGAFQVDVKVVVVLQATNSSTAAIIILRVMVWLLPT